MSALDSSIRPIQLPELPKLPALTLPTLPSIAPPAPLPVPLSGLPGTPERAAHVDSIVHANRAKTPPSAMGKRANPRMTIEELNQQDPDELRDRFLSTKYDTRTPVQQVLDLIDLPRNVIANIAFHGAAGEAARKGDYGTFGLPKVTVSDALRNAGVENRVALGLGGFVGDVLTDPLTYIGPAGWGIEAGGVGIRAGGKALLKRATREAAVGGIEAVSDPLAKGVLRAAGVAEAPSAIQDVRRLVQGDPSKSIAEKVFAPLGGETTSSGGVFAKYGQMGKHAENVAEHPNIDAVQNFIGQYGRGTGGGIKLGQGGSEIAHIPFTDTTLQVPGFTSTAARSLAALHLARDRDLSNAFGATDKGTNAVSQVKPIIDQMRTELGQAHDASAVAVGGGKRGELIDQLHSAFSDVPEQARKDFVSLADAAAIAKGKSPEEWWSKNIAGFKKGLDGGIEPLYQIDAWHGSPHTFDKFSTSAIGTGEGAQAYGHGLYFASNEKVAQHYRRALSENVFEKDGQTVAGGSALREYFKPGEIVPSYGGHDRVIAFNENGLRFGGGGWEVKVQSVRKTPNGWEIEPGSTPRTHFTTPDSREMKQVLKSRGWNERDGGKLYRVELAPEDHHLLDWDKPISEQSPFVQDALRKAGYFHDGDANDLHTGEDLYKGLERNWNDIPDAKTKLGYGDGDALSSDDAAKLASMRLRELGIRGVKYLDGSSRSAGDGAHNYVMFDDADVAIKQMFQGEKGAVSFQKDGRALIHALSNPDASTVSHELGHVFRRGLDDVERGVVETHYGITDGKWSVPHEERYAQDFERYLATGETSNPQLKGVFDRFKAWLANLYKSIVGTPLEQQLSPAMKEHFDKLLGSGLSKDIGSIQTADDAERAANTMRFADSMTQKAEQIAQIVRENQPEKITDLNANGVAHLGELYKEAESMRDLADGWRKASAATGPEAADAYGQVVDAAQRYRALVGGTLRTHIDPKTLAASEQIRQMLGTDDHTVGVTALGSLKGALGNLFGHDSPVTNWVDNADRAVRNKFGIRSGEYPKRVADINYRANSGAIEQGGEVMGQFTSDIKGLMQKHGLPVTSYDDVAALSSIYAYQAAAQRLGIPLKEAMFLKEVKNGKLVPGAFMERMNELMKVMREKGAGRDFHAGLKQIADNAAKQLESFGTKEQGAYQLNHMLSFYIPNVPKIETQLALRGKKGSLAWESKAVSDHPHPRQAFQTQRSTNIYQFQDHQTGEWMQFREMDRDRAAVGPAKMQVIERSNPKAANEIKELQRVIEKYESLGDKAPPARPSDFFSVNKAAAEGKLGALSIDPGKEFFEPSLPMWMGQRAASHERSMANAELAGLMNHAGIMNSDTFLNIVGKVGDSAKTIKLPGGTELRVRTVKSPFGGDIPIMYGNGESFRPLSRAMAGYADNPMISALWDAGKDMVLPEKLADLIEQKALAFKDENLAGLLSAMEKATGAFRSVTLLHPSWMIFDVVGNIANAFSGDIHIGYMLDELKTGMMVKWAEMHPERVKDLVVKLPTGELHGQAALDYYKSVGALDRNFPANMGAALTTSGATGLPSQFNRVGLIPDLKTDHAYNLARNSGLLGKPGAAAASGMSLGWDRINRYVLSPWVRTNGFVNDAMRVAAHNALLRQGHDSASATDKMRRALFDYSDLTHFERKYMRNIFPFWSWMRNNLPYQMSLLFQRPSYISAAPKVQKALEEAIAGEQQVPMGLRPNWMRQSLATQIGADPDSRLAYMLGNSLPQTELYNVIQGIMGAKGAQETLHYFGSALNPVVGAPLQLGAGQEYFSGRQIGSDVGEGDISTGEFLTNLVRPVNEARKIAASKSVGEGVGRALIGGRLQNFSQDRITSTRGRDLRDQAESVRRAVTRAESGGASSVKQRARLLQIYAEAMRLGLDQEVRVPRWAKNALGNMQEASP